MEELINRTNVHSVINVSLGNQDEGYRQYSFYIESEHNGGIKINTVLAVARMLNAVSIYVYLGDQLLLVNPKAYKDKTPIDETYLNNWKEN